VKIPKSVQVGQYKIPITVVDGIHVDGEDCRGFFRETDGGGEIVLDKNNTDRRMVAVFLHEVLHAISETYGLGMKHGQIYGAAEGLAQALKGVKL
jgi:hypothetical protein